MINWEELSHIHVIRKLDEVLGSWFGADVFFLDHKGELRNWQSGGRFKYSNPLTEQLFKREVVQKKVAAHFRELTEKLFRSPEQSVTETGICGFEQIFHVKIANGNEFLGSVLAFPVYTTTPDVSQNKVSELGDVSKLVSGARVIEGKDLAYFKQLVELVSQEILGFHLEISRREDRISALNQELGNRYRYENMIGKSKPMQDLYALLDKIKTSESTVLVQGENGTGKELIAKAIHYNSPRNEKPFVTVNCSAFNENLLDSELFGHIKGAFTGAVKDKKGLFETADKGTLFLDEVGDMSAAMQVKLLRVLQEGTLIPVGGTEVRRVDVRVIAATNRDLKDMIEKGQFREDLYYRINVINIHVPPLRERKEDIPVLIDYFLATGCKERNIPLKKMASRALEKFYDYPWPGNIRELQNEIERLLVLGDEEKIISHESLSARIRDWGEKSKVQGVRLSGKLKDAIEELEKTMIREGLKRVNWNKSKLAKELGISRAGLIMKVEKYELDKRKFAKKNDPFNDDPDSEAA
ncbi:MAG: sigma-54 interaction domain-containing protein [Bacteriovoracia bacterium]